MEGTSGGSSRIYFSLPKLESTQLKGWGERKGAVKKEIMGSVFFSTFIKNSFQEGIGGSGSSLLLMDKLALADECS